MSWPSIKIFSKLSFVGVSSDSLANYAYVLACCKFTVSVSSGESHKMLEHICKRKISELRDEINGRFESEDNTASLNHALAVIDGTADLANMKMSIGNISDYSYFTRLTTAELINLHSASSLWYDMRLRKKMELSTRVFQWRIVKELLNRSDGKELAKILLLSESIEAENYARNLNIPYTAGDIPQAFIPAAYPGDEELLKHINALACAADYVSREELIEIADYIQTEILEKGATGNHLELLNAILSTGMPGFNYPRIIKEFEKITRSLSKSKAKYDIELAPYFYTLWVLTHKPTYLSRFEKTARRCYLALAKNKTYPDLGINLEDSNSLSYAIKFLQVNRKSLWLINEKYNIDRIISRDRNTQTSSVI